MNEVSSSSHSLTSFILKPPVCHLIPNSSPSPADSGPEGHGGGVRTRSASFSSSLLFSLPPSSSSSSSSLYYLPVFFIIIIIMSFCFPFLKFFILLNIYFMISAHLLSEGKASLASLLVDYSLKDIVILKLWKSRVRASCHLPDPISRGRD